jgi:D-glycero-D-manno-heptose 1,7-bisphosphate phosphatase
MSQPRPAVFLDRDGVINRAYVREGKPSPARSLEEFELLPRVADACSILKELGPLIVVTNQPDVGRGTLSRAAVEEIHQEIFRLLPISRIEVCYEDGRDPKSLFYKPAPGMLLRAASEMNLNLCESIMIGDRWRDIDCGRVAGCLTIWIDHGHDEPLRNAPDHAVPDLLAAAELLQRLGKIPQDRP